MKILGYKLWRGIYPQWYYDLYHSHLQEWKLKFIRWFDDLFPGKYCWADCVTWAFSPSRWNPFNMDSSGGCESESKETPDSTCYCGGWQGGVCFAKLPKKEQERIIAERKKEWELQKDELPF